MRLAKLFVWLTLLPGPALQPVPAQQLPPAPQLPAQKQQATNKTGDGTTRADHSRDGQARDGQTAAEAALRDAVARNPQSFDAHYALGSFFAGQGRLAEAIPHFEQAARIAPAHYACGHDLALAYFKTGRLADAARKIREMLAREDTAELHNLLGAVEEASGNVEVAAKELQQAAEMDPSEKHVFDFGNILLRYRAYDGALKILRFGTERFPRSAQLKVAFGAALYSLAQYEQAVEALCQAVDLNPADSRALYFLGKMHDVSPAMSAEVIRRMENFVRLYPENAGAHYYYAMSLWKGSGQESEDHAEEVERLLRKAVTLDANLHEAHFELASLYERQGRDEDAIRHYRRVTEIQPELDSAYYRLARIYQRLGQAEPAREALETYQRLHQKSRAEEETTRPPALIVK